METNEEMYLNDWKEDVPKMSKEELALIISKEDDYNPKYIEIVKEEFAKRPSLREQVQNTKAAAEEEREKDESQDENSDMSLPIWLVVLFIGLAGLGSLRNGNVPMFILSMYCVWLFIYKKENSIHVAQAIFIINICVLILSLLLGDAEYRMGSWLLLAIIGISLNLGCYYYLNKSESVDKFIPKEIRYLKNLDYFLIALPIIFYIIGILSH